MKTKKQTKTRNQAKKIKEAIKTGAFFAVPVILVLFVFVFNSVKSFNLF